MNKKLKIALFVFVGILVIVLGFLLFPKKINQPRISFENKSFQVELAQTDEERQQGLMYREFLGEDKGMLFIFPEEGVHVFWMKNTVIPLDMIRIDEIDGKNRVVDVQTANPCITQECEIYTPAGNSRFVLEINAGLAEKYNINAGDLIYIEI